MVKNVFRSLGLVCLILAAGVVSLRAQNEAPAANNNAAPKSASKQTSTFPFGKPFTGSTENFSFTMTINKLGDGEYEATGTVNVTCPYGTISSWHQKIFLSLYSNSELVEKIYIPTTKVNAGEYKAYKRFKTDKFFNKFYFWDSWKVYYKG